MDTIHALLTRRSIRKYTDRKVTDSQIETLLRAAMHAPSAFNRQPWEFIVIDSKTRLAELDAVISHADMIKDASAAILVLGDKKAEPSLEFIIQNNSAVTQNILLAAHALGLGAVWIAVYPLQEAMDVVMKFFNLPDHLYPVSLIPIGFPAENFPEEDRYNPERVHLNRW